MSVETQFMFAGWDNFDWRQRRACPHAHDAKLDGT